LFYYKSKLHKSPKFIFEFVLFGLNFPAGFRTIALIPHVIGRDPSDTNDDYNCVETSTSTAGTQGQGCSRLALYCDEIDYKTGTCK
jgi:hypothetical protein